MMVAALNTSSETTEANDTSTVLVVEDEGIVREGLGLILQRAGYGVALAAHGQEALDLLRTGPTPSLIVLDMMMPVVDGWRFLATKRQNPSLAPIPVIIATAMGVASVEWASSLGAVALFRKPIDVEALLQEIARWCPPNAPGEP
jgi:CheY-like chemotaxis protein